MGDARETEKAPDAFRTISEVADDLELPQHVLRFWESRFTQIKPVKRAGGRRFYRPEDVDLLRGIRHLLYTDGFTIKGAQRILKDQGVRYVQDLGIEREVASMRSARPARNAGGDGVTFGGLLGLLPRRRGKGRGTGRGGEEDVLPELPESAELPLPFPDAEADRDLASEPAAPPMPLREGRARSTREERRDPGFEPPREPPARSRPARDERPSGSDRRDPGPDRRADDARREPSFGRFEADHDGPSHRRPAERGDIDGDSDPDARVRRAPRMNPRADVGMTEDASAHPEDGEPVSPAGPGRRPTDRVEPVLRPMQRPSRGPAARLSLQDDAAARHSPELDDPLLPFLDDFSPAPQVSEPIEDRIRRLKAQDRRPPRPHEGPAQEQDIRRDPRPTHDPRHPAGYAQEPARDARSAHLSPEPEVISRPADEFVPPRARRSVSDDPEWRAAGEGQPRHRERDQRPLLRDGDWRQTDWVEAGQDADWQDESRWAGDAAPEAPRDTFSGRPADEEWDAAGSRPTEPPAPYRQAPRATEPEYSMNDQDHRSLDRPLDRPPAERPRRPGLSQGEPRREPLLGAPQGYAPQGTPGRSPRPETYGPDTYGAGDAPARQPRSAVGWQGEAIRRAIDEEWGEGAPQALPRATRVGPLIGPISEEDEDGIPMPEAEQRLLAERMSVRGVGPQRAYAPAVPPVRQSPERNWAGAASPGDEVTASPVRPPSEPSQRLPREPLRPGPPEQYLPPHLRSEPRVVGQAPVAAPVLSRDDVHRMQSALYELGECRRLMDGLIGRRGEARTGD